MYLSLYCKGSKRVTQGFTVRGSWRPNRTAIYWPPLLWPSALSFLFSWCSTRGPGAQLSAECWLSLPPCHQQVSKTTGGPEGPFGREWLSLPHLISNFSGPQLSDFLSSQSYIIVQRPLNRLLKPWNGMFDCHQAEITVMQFTGHSLLVHHSLAAQWDLHFVPYHQPSSPAWFLSINGHWDVSLPLSLEWHVCRAEGQNTTVSVW